MIKFMTIWAQWVLATFVGSLAIVTLGFVYSFFGGSIGIFLSWFLTPLSTPILQWLWMRRRLPSFSLVWVATYFMSFAIGFFVACSVSEIAGRTMLARFLMSAASGFVMGVFQNLGLRRVFDLSKSQINSLGHNWAVSTMVGLVLGGTVSEALIKSKAALGWVLFPLIVSVAVAGFQGYVLQGLIDTGRRI